MTFNNPQNQPSVEQLTASTTQSGQEHSLETLEDDPDTTIIEDLGTPLSDFKSQPLYWL